VGHEDQLCAFIGERGRDFREVGVIADFDPELDFWVIENC
jgi:hypothetical protein